MKVVSSKNSSSFFDNLFNYFIQSGLNEQSGYEEFRKKAVEYIQVNIEDMENLKKIDSFKAESIYNEDLYHFPKKMNSVQKLNTIISFDNFINAIKNETTDQHPALRKDVKHRHSFPGIDAYDYVGHNELNIKHSKISHGLLHEEN